MTTCAILYCNSEVNNYSTILDTITLNICLYFMVNIPNLFCWRFLLGWRSTKMVEKENGLQYKLITIFYNKRETHPSNVFGTIAHTIALSFLKNIHRYFSDLSVRIHAEGCLWSASGLRRKKLWACSNEGLRFSFSLKPSYVVKLCVVKALNVLLGELFALFTFINIQFSSNKGEK